MNLLQSSGASPGNRIVMEQKWSRIVWAHWPVDPSQVAALLPPALSPETYDGSAWIGLVPFQMSDLRLAGVLSGVSSALRVSAFGEVNVRTYVQGPDGRTGVWFATLDADRLLAVITARVAFGLPYRGAAIRLSVTAEGGCERIAWNSVRRKDSARAALIVAPDDVEPQVAAPGLERFLVERYALYSWWHGQLLRGSLSHAPWMVRGARLIDVENGTVDATGLRVAGAPHLLVGEPVEVRIHPFSRVRRSVSSELGVRARRRVSVPRQ